MKPRITIITLGVDDLDKALTFYRDGLGLPTQGIIGKEFEHGAVVFFELQHGVKLALWPRTSIAHDTHLPVQAPSATDFTLAQKSAAKKKSTW
jgi:catechol 2,3-dioxygenase-like lactoylglutathione lyase family enzyme